MSTPIHVVRPSNKHCWAKSIVISLLLSLPSVSAMAIQIDLNGLIITDNAAGDLDPTLGIIVFNEQNLISGNGLPGLYSASGRLENGSGSAQSSNLADSLTLTDLIVRATGPVFGSIIFADSGAPQPPTVGGTVSLDGNWAQGASNAPASVINGWIGLTGGVLFTGDVLDTDSGDLFNLVDQPLSFGSGGVSASSNTGNSFGPLSSTNTSGIPIFPNFSILSGGVVGVSGQLDFSLENSNDGFYLPTSATVTVNAVPIPAAVWLFGSGLLGLVGTARRNKA